MPKQIITEEEYKNCIKYMRKAGDLGRKPAPFWVWLIIMIILGYISYFFSLMLAGYVIPGASEKSQSIVAMAIGFQVPIILVFFNFTGGAQLYRTSLLRKCHKQLKLNNIEATAKYIALEDAQHADDGDSEWLQTISRVAKYPDDKGSYFLLIYGIFFAVLICIFSTYIRQQALLKYINTNVDATQVNLSSSLFVSFGLAFIFFNIFSLYVGYKYSFAGRQSRQAYKEVKQYNSQH